MIRGRFWLITLLVGALLLAPPPLFAGGKRLQASPERLQALYIQRLVKYVSWPEHASPQPGQPYIIAATDAASLRPYFREPAIAARFKLVQWPAKSFHILILNNAPKREAAAILQRTRGLPILSIRSGPINRGAGAAISFHRVAGKLKLYINPRAVDRAGLTVSSKLMRIARIQREGQQ